MLISIDRSRIVLHLETCQHYGYVSEGKSYTLLISCRILDLEIIYPSVAEAERALDSRLLVLLFAFLHELIFPIVEHFLIRLSVL